MTRDTKLKLQFQYKTTINEQDDDEIVVRPDFGVKKVATTLISEYVHRVPFLLRPRSLQAKPRLPSNHLDYVVESDTTIKQGVNFNPYWPVDLLCQTQSRLSILLCFHLFFVLLSTQLPFSVEQPHSSPPFFTSIYRANSFTTVFEFLHNARTRAIVADAVAIFPRKDHKDHQALQDRWTTRARRRKWTNGNGTNGWILVILTQTSLIREMPPSNPCRTTRPTVSLYLC